MSNTDTPAAPALDDDVRALREALGSEIEIRDWQYTGCNTVEGKAPDGEWWEIAHPCPLDGTARFIAAAHPARIARVLDALERERTSRQAAQVELEQAREDRNRGRVQGFRDAARVYRERIEQAQRERDEARAALAGAQQAGVNAAG